MQRFSALLRTPMKRMLPVFARAQHTETHITNSELPPHFKGSDYFIKVQPFTAEDQKKVDEIIKTDYALFKTPEWKAKIPLRETADNVVPDTRFIYKTNKAEIDSNPELLEAHKASAAFHDRRDAIVSSLRNTGSIYSWIKNQPGFPQHLTEKDKENLHKLDERLKIFYEEEIAKPQTLNHYPETPIETQNKYRLYVHYTMIAIVLLLPYWKYQDYKKQKKAKAGK